MSRAWQIAARALRELGEERALLDELLEELLAVGLGERRPAP